MPLLVTSNNAFLKLLSFRMFIVLAYQIMAIVVGWHIFELTHDTLALGMIGLAEVIPYFSCADMPASAPGVSCLDKKARCAALPLRRIRHDRARPPR